MDLIATGFVILTTLSLFLLVCILSYHSSKVKMIPTFTIAFAFWIGYVYLLSSSGVLSSLAFPPRVPLLIILPVLLFSVYISGSASFRDVLSRMPSHVPVYLQSFRVGVEVLIYGGFAEGIFPERATFNGLNYDILVGISAIAVGFLVHSGKIGAPGLMAWNIIGLSILSVTVYAFLSSYYFYNHLGLPEPNTRFTNFPYILLAAVLLPTAVFLHIISLRQVKPRLRTLTSKVGHD